MPALEEVIGDVFRWKRKMGGKRVQPFGQVIADHLAGHRQGVEPPFRPQAEVVGEDQSVKLSVMAQAGGVDERARELPAKLRQARPIKPFGLAVRPADANTEDGEARVADIGLDRQFAQCKI
jgi:hypothetical protein